jgi:tRNA 2-thiouridine synthesizing protein B
MLHTLSSFPWQCDIARYCAVRDGDDLLLISDGVIAASGGLS